MRTIDAAETAAALPWGPLVEAMLRMFERERRGEARAAPRTAVPLAAGGTMLLMPAADAEFAALKTVTVHAGNAAHGLPVVQGEVVLLDAATGTRLLALDGNVLTARRTAALSLAGAMRAGRTGAEHVLLIGAGVQARAHAEALAELWGVRRLAIHARTAAHAEDLARHMRSLGVEAQAIAEVTPWYAKRVTMSPVPPVWAVAMRMARSLASLPVQVNIRLSSGSAKVAVRSMLAQKTGARRLPSAFQGRSARTESRVLLQSRAEPASTRPTMLLRTGSARRMT